MTEKQTQTQALTVPEAGKAEVIPGYGSASGFELLQRGAQALAASSMVPEAYSGKIANCIVALEMALRMKVSPMMVMQNLYVIHGKPSWSSAFLIGALNGSLHYEKVKYSMFGEKGKDSRGCVASTVDKATGEVIEGPEVTIAIAKADGWWGRKDSKWPRMPELMLRYRAGAWLVRTVAPEMCMGFPGDDEVLDSGNALMPADVLVEPGAPQQVEAAKEEPKPKRRRTKAPEKPKEEPPTEAQPAAEAMEQTNAPGPPQTVTVQAAAAQPEPKKFNSPF